ncbi:unnamed protein product [Candidatus Paraburkholderia kirkii UZHbot1]|uniref:WGS project CAFE00000000 data, contig bkir_c89 n=1 Tax=Candidatus Paraburkholderia kirkii UZHbot1 TaxID=1055526 RepID=U3UB66_9BURK|nr:unnamed protein product [Candidatus Paraburkholderia kirkii UZHbot1]
MRNDGNDQKEMEHNFGLLDANNAKLPAYHAVKHLFGFTARCEERALFHRRKREIRRPQVPDGTRDEVCRGCYGAGNVMNVDVSRLPAGAVVTDLYGKPRAGRGLLAVTEAQGPVFITVAS